MAAPCDGHSVSWGLARVLRVHHTLNHALDFPAHRGRKRHNNNTHRRARNLRGCVRLQWQLDTTSTHQDPFPKSNPLFSNTSPATSQTPVGSCQQQQANPLNFPLAVPGSVSPSVPQEPPYVFLVTLPSRQLLLEAPRRPQPLLGQVPDPLLHEAQGLLPCANELQQASQVPPEGCLGKKHALHGECRESSCQRSLWAAPRHWGGLSISAELI